MPAVVTFSPSAGINFMAGAPQVVEKLAAH
jgi:hypothetical protein